MLAGTPQLRHAVRVVHRLRGVVGIVLHAQRDTDI